MPVQLNSQTGSSEQVDETLRRKTSASVRVSTPGIIQSFDAENCTATVQPAISGWGQDSAGNLVSKDLPLLQDCPVIFPRGGGVSITFPLSEGDECLIMFADRGIDFWHQSGGINKAVDDRMHDLSDAFVIPGPTSNPRALKGVSTNSIQIRTDSGAQFIELTQSGSVNITAPIITLNGDVQVNGAVTSTGDMKAGSISVQSHTHTGVQPGNSSTGKPE
ncbi:translation initiation factor IF-2 [Rosenbergiella collisarenosi]|uniref:Gp138 family membrane-puncturing spike protein n=1 Tax=Rosenbergiella collisarenosi TaxID=1544695 RepID=UPI001BDAA124|nr:Gp138 family membrane-puncturing spike protein [Rosenbergiella collisarenosi]MBT0720457.1 translation initiation factor IF-2 [Rosenbergiella collisarenosi]